MSHRFFTALLLLSSLVITIADHAAANPAVDVRILTDAMAKIAPPDSLKAVEGNIVQQEWQYFLKHKAFTLNDSVVKVPKFIRKVLDIYHWAEENFNTYDSTYVGSTGYRGRILIVNENWNDGYYIHPMNTFSLKMMSDFNSTIGAKVHYSVLSLGFSINLHDIRHNSIRKSSLGLRMARFSLEGTYWKNTTGTTIRQFGAYNNGKFIDEKFNGLSFEGLSIYGNYYFNHRRCAVGAAYDASLVQKRSAGMWMAGFVTNFYDVKFDFAKLPQNLQDYYLYPFTKYRLHYNAYNLTGGYTYNWVISPKFIFNIKGLPGVGIAYAYNSSTDGSNALASLYMAGKIAITYSNKRFIASLQSEGHINAYVNSSVGFADSKLVITAWVGFRF